LKPIFFSFAAGGAAKCPADVGRSAAEKLAAALPYQTSGEKSSAQAPLAGQAVARKASIDPIRRSHRLGNPWQVGACQAGSAFSEAENAMQMTLEDIRPTRLPPPRTPRKRKRGVSVQTAAVTAILFAVGLVLLSGRAPAPNPPAPPVVAAPPPDWLAMDDPPALYALSAPQLAGLPQSYAVRLNRLGGGRQDSLTFGRPDGAAAFFQLTLYRVGRENAPDVPFFVDLVRQGAAIDLAVTRSANIANLPTRFGPLETAAVDLAAGDAPPMACLGFRGAGLDGTFRLSGFACGTKVSPISRSALACLLNRLELDGEGGDPALVTYFADSEMNRSRPCAGAALDADPQADRQANWIARNDAPPPLRLRKMP
jgi:hypothetical protein